MKATTEEQIKWLQNQIENKKNRLKLIESAARRRRLSSSEKFEVDKAKYDILITESILDMINGKQS